jgi:hypothetical protein
MVSLPSSHSPERVEEALASTGPGFFYEQSLMFRVAARDD